MSNTAVAFCWNLSGTKVLSPHQKAVRVPSSFLGNRKTTRPGWTTGNLSQEESGKYLRMYSVVFEVWHWHRARGRMICKRQKMVFSPSTLGFKKKMNSFGLRNQLGSSQEFPRKIPLYLWALARSEKVNVFSYQLLPHSYFSMLLHFPVAICVFSFC